MPFIDLVDSPLAPGVSPVRIHYRDAGSGPPLVFLHSGWGYRIYPFDQQIDPIVQRHRLVIPDRSGYGESTAIDDLPVDFHRRAMIETRSVLDALGLNRPVLWGHSDGAIIALLLALAHPDRVSATIVEATHLYKQKPRSRAFFEAIIANPESLGASTSALLASDHGPGWPRVIERHSRAWRDIAISAAAPDEDFYGGRLADVAVTVLMIHGARDPRTEPGEIDALASAFTQAGDHEHGRPRFRNRVVVLPDGGHSPHTERSTAGDVTRAATRFLADVATSLQSDPAQSTHS